MVRVEMIMNDTITFTSNVDFNTVQLMMNSDFITLNRNTIKVEAKEVTSDGLVRFYGLKAKPEEYFK
ncbi:hypothetical protein [Bacillus sp. V5-8f]|uniref:hypothetical protein n=1 Tax=Bacillus sp. V5-8f TaxID=2053044 RepID=UPI000C7791BE|nr:hypothetical protein [Bacillus sp. V5-8f]PLT32119.1 hypothetical protein CUU64_21385 [Bacillus sp. V5-8f]